MNGSLIERSVYIVEDKRNRLSVHHVNKLITEVSRMSNSNLRLVANGDKQFPYSLAMVNGYQRVILISGSLRDVYNFLQGSAFMLKMYNVK